MAHQMHYLSMFDHFDLLSAFVIEYFQSSVLQCTQTLLNNALFFSLFVLF